MKDQFDHLLSSSFNLYLEHKLLKEGEAYTNTTGELFQSDQNQVNGVNYSNSPVSQWVYDSSVDGAIVPTGVFLGPDAFVGRGISGVSLNFLGGGAYHSGNYSVSGAYAKKDFNFYFMPEEDAELLLETAFSSKDPLTAINESKNYNVNAPCIIVNSKDSKNDPFAFGGMDETNSHYQAVIITNNNYHKDGAMSIFRDLNETCFPVIDSADVPFNSMGDLKTGLFNYEDLYLKYPNSNQYATVDRVTVQGVRQRSEGRKNFYLAYAEFRLLSYRFPRV